MPEPLILGDIARPGVPVPVLDVQVTDGIAFVTIANPPANTLGPQVRQALWEVFTGFATDDGPKAVVLLARGRLFSAGIDVREYDGRVASPDLGALCDLVESCASPVVAAISGAALGGGAELAMAAHYRIAATDAVIGLPEVTLGLVPGAGGTQRLSRLIGAEAALDMILDGRPRGAAQAQAVGLIDALTEGDVAASAAAFAQGLIDNAAGPRPARGLRRHMTDGAGWMRTIAARRAALGPRPLLAAARAVDCVEAALLLPFANAIAFEGDAFASCLAHPQSRALRHVFLAERRIDARLLSRGGEGRRAASPDGEGAVAALVAAMDRAIMWLVGVGISEVEIDDALIGYGFPAGPFGGEMGDADHDWRSGAAPGALPAEAGGDEASGVRSQLYDAIVRRCLGALVAEGGRLVEAGAVARPADVDALAVHGLGFPRWHGGPMKAAEIAGLDPLLAEMAAWAEEDEVWAVPRSLADDSDSAPPPWDVRRAVRPAVTG